MQSPLHYSISACPPHAKSRPNGFESPRCTSIRQPFNPSWLSRNRILEFDIVQWVALNETRPNQANRKPQVRHGQQRQPRKKRCGHPIQVAQSRGALRNVAVMGRAVTNECETSIAASVTNVGAPDFTIIISDRTEPVPANPWWNSATAHRHIAKSLVTPRGLEPRTCRLEVSCSIQLS